MQKFNELRGTENYTSYTFGFDRLFQPRYEIGDPLHFYSNRYYYCT